MSIDIITKNNLDEFKTDFNIVESSQAKLFEHFVNYIIVKKYYSSDFEFQSLSTGEASPGIDGIAIIVNNCICTDEEDINNLISSNKQLEVDFIFIQAKIPNKFDTSDIGSFLRCVQLFFTDTDIFKLEEMKNFIKIKDCIYNKSKYFITRKPTITLFYSSLGKYNNEDTNINATINHGIKNLEDTSLFKEVKFIPCDLEVCNELYMYTKRNIEISITIPGNSIRLDATDKIKSAYFSILPFSEFKKIILDENGKLRKIFDDNIRDFLEIKKNSVNKKIYDTLEKGDFSNFCFLNNGVTIIAEKITGAGNNITLLNCQIVNGCQTSNVLYEARNIADIDKVFIPVKIIETEDSEIRINITHATNNQTQVKIVQLESLNNFQKKLEQFYTVKSSSLGNERLYYERRANQFKGEQISLSKIISVEMQIKAFYSMFCEKPYLISGSFGKVLKNIGKELFSEKHKFDAYFASALTYNKFLELHNKKLINNDLWYFRYHTIMLFKYFATKRNTPNFNSKDIEPYCNDIISYLSDDSLCKKTFNEVHNFLLSIDKINIKERQHSKLKEKNEIILSNVKSYFFRKTYESHIRE